MWREFQHGPAFPARFDSTCVDCDGDIEQGESIIMTDAGAVHAECFDHSECPEGSTCGGDE